MREERMAHSLSLVLSFATEPSISLTISTIYSGLLLLLMGNGDGRQIQILIMAVAILFSLTVVYFLSIRFLFIFLVIFYSLPWHWLGLVCVFREISRYLYIYLLLTFEGSNIPGNHSFLLFHASYTDKNWFYIRKVFVGTH